MQNIHDCVFDCGLQHLRTLGPLFTWYNKRAKNLIEKRLDRMLGNGAWISKFAEGFVHVMPQEIMDNSTLLHSVPMQLEKIHKSFQFFNFMCELESFQDVVRTSWDKPWYGDPMAILCKRLRNVKDALIKLNKANGNLHNKMHGARQNLADIRERLSHNSTAQLLDLEKSACKDIESCLLQEEAFLQQKSRVKWLSSGDDNNGTIVFGHRAASQVAVDYFTSNLATSSVHTDCDLSQLDFNQVTEAHIRTLKAPFTSDLIYSTLKRTKKNIALWPDIGLMC
ncbi:hypothetical protein AgCh_021523 [Apium graveolens]